MRKEGGPIEKVALHQWAKYRRSGYVFVEDGEKKYAEQQANRSPEEVEADDAGASKKKKKKKKVMRRQG